MQTIERFLSDLDGKLCGVCDCQRAVEQTASILERYTADPFPLPDRLTTLGSGKYARHLVYHSPDCGCCVVAMVWGPGQGTPVHDHAGTWCVEGCVRGRLRITNYRLDEELANDRVRMTRQESIDVCPGAVGSLIPPFEHHTIENPFDEPAITLHVYGKELDVCTRFLEEEPGIYRVERVNMAYCSVPASA